MSQAITDQYPDWAVFYSTLANALLQYKDNAKELYRKVLYAYQSAQVEIPNRQDGDEQLDMDPFTVFASFNMGIHIEKRKRLM